MNKCGFSRSLNAIVIRKMTTFFSYFLRKLVRLRSLPQLLRQRTEETAYWNGG